ncbi:Leucine-rich repeat family protein [Perilla frutescens var. hirtella]|uniref:Leucine-rich repeat family protein n=1 Tax=Perilla frutescens var. hirtella TaxID=608512 RepID=A0AAD4IU79_PERFH|nr:Leucine-rich repeat family protein [Perilla frutescens var. hirtella]
MTMMITPFLFLLFLLPYASFSHTLRGLFIDCGATVAYKINGLEWLPDAGYISSGTSKNVEAPVFFPTTIASLRTFPLKGNVFKKFCYEIPVDRRTKKYLIRTTFYYGGVNGNADPPVFDLIVDGTMWSVVNTTADYVMGNLSSYEGVFMPTGKNLSVCLSANAYTDSDPFISALEVVPLWDQLYNSIDFRYYSLNLVARHSFGHNGPMIGYPDDQFNRYWEPYGGNSVFQSTSANVSVAGIWNLPPSKVFQTGLVKSLADQPLELLWPPSPLPLPIRYYYIALYFADIDQTSFSGSSRMLDVTINGVTHINNLNVIPAGVAVFVNKWPLAGLTNLTLSPSPGSSVGPVINAAEAFEVLQNGGKTLSRDAIAMINLRSSFQNPPDDWHGDPCLPPQYSWTGVTCSLGQNRIRVVTLNLTNMGLLGSLSPNISSLTALTSILLQNNSLSGSIPDLSSLRRLQFLHLEDNLLGGTIPTSMGNLTNLSELFLQNNNLTGKVPSNLVGKPGLTLRYTPGNPFLIP